MRSLLLGFFLFGCASTVALAQSPFTPSAPAAGSDGPLLGPPSITVPEMPGPQVTPPAPAPARASKPLPRILRLPPTGAPADEERPGGKLFNGKWKQRQAAAAKVPPPVPGSLEDNPPTVTLPNVPSAPPAADPVLKSRRYGPLEVFPKPKASDRAGNPLSIKRPLLAW